MLFLGFEIPALEDHANWSTLSDQVRRLPDWARYVICGFLVLLTLHFLPFVETPLFLVWG